MSPSPKVTQSHPDEFNDYDEDDESESDDGMFSYARPATADQPTQPSPFHRNTVGSASSDRRRTETVSQARHHQSSRNYESRRDVERTPPYSLSAPNSASPPGAAYVARPRGSSTAPEPAVSPRGDAIYSIDLGTRGRVHQRQGFRAAVSPDLEEKNIEFSLHDGHIDGERVLRRGVDDARREPYLRDGPDRKYGVGQDLRQSHTWSESVEGRTGIHLDTLHPHQRQMLEGDSIRSVSGRDRSRRANCDFKAQDTIDTTSDLDEDSPYAEVRASVSNWDDPSIPALTLRAWLVGLTLTTLLGCANTFLAFRYPAPVVTPLVALILAYPLGKFLAIVTPIRSFRLPRRLGLGDSISLNPGPFSQKEHAVIVMMANVALTPPYALNFCVATEIFYESRYSFTFDFLLVLSSSLLGYGVAGLYRRFLVWPASLVWPQDLVLTTIIATFHAEEDSEPGATGLSRFKMFIVVIVSSFFYYWLPGYLFQALSAFSFVCWIAPGNTVINQLFGVTSGLGMSLLTFDWSQITFISSPLIVPWWAIANIFVCFAATNWVISPILYYTNTWSSGYLPIASSSVFDRFGNHYNISRIFSQADRLIIQDAYTEYSPLYLSSTYACAIGLAFAVLPAAIVHTVIYHGRDIYAKARGQQTEREDIHMKLMKRYPEVPDFVYALFCVVSLTIALLATGVWDTGTPVWSIIIAFFFGAVCLLPAGFVYAMTTTTLSINVPSELIAGYMMPGNPLANMLFKTYALTTTINGLSFVQDLKLGHYMKIPPRTTFLVQVVAILVSCSAQVAVVRWLVGNVPDFCQLGQSAALICPTTRTYYSASIIWGAIGPARLFGIGKQYSPLLVCILLGAIAPVVTWLLAKRWPKSWLAFVSVPVALNGAAFAPNANGINYSSWFIVGFIFQYLIRRQYFGWWSRYVYLISSGLDSGTTISALIIFFSVMLPKGGTLSLEWWGNNVYKRTLDYQAVSHLQAPPDGFGPTVW